MITDHSTSIIGVGMGQVSLFARNLMCITLPFGFLLLPFFICFSIPISVLSLDINFFSSRPFLYSARFDFLRVDLFYARGLETGGEGTGVARLGYR